MALHEIEFNGVTCYVNVTACDEFPGLPGLEFGVLDATAAEFMEMSRHIHSCGECWGSDEIHTILSEIHVLHAEIMRCNAFLRGEFFTTDSSPEINPIKKTQEAIRQVMLCETSIQRITRELVREMNRLHM